MNIRDFAFSMRYGFRGVPVELAGRHYRFDISLRRWNFSGEEEVRNAIASEINAGDLAVDVGANFGMHTLIMASKVGEHGKVIAFEPVPANLRLLNKNIRLNHFDSLVDVRACAVSDCPTKSLRMTMDTNSLEPSASISTKSTEKKQEIEVDNVALDESLANVSTSHKCFIKIDVEGAELSVLRSAQKTLARFKPTLLIEVHDYALPSFNESTESVYAFLNEQGFSITQLSDMSNHNGQYHHILAKPN